MSKAKEAGEIKLKDGLTVKEALGLFLKAKPTKTGKKAAPKRKKAKR